MSRPPGVFSARPIRSVWPLLVGLIVVTAAAAATGLRLRHHPGIDLAMAVAACAAIDACLALFGILWLVRGARTEHRVQADFLARADTLKGETDARIQAVNERLQFALRASGYGVWETLLSDGRMVWDDRMYELYGVSRETFDAALSGESALIHPDDVEAVGIHRKEVLDGGAKQYHIDYRIVRPDGVRHIEAHGFVHRDSDGRPRRFAGLARDITERKLLEEKLQHSEEISLRVSRLAQIGAWELDNGGKKLRWEPELYRIAEVELGYEPSLAKMTGFFPDEHADHFEAAVDQAVRAGRSFDMECPFVTGLGRRRWVRVIGRAEFRDKRPIRVFGAIQDASVRCEAEEARRKLEAQLFQVQKMETLGTLAGGIAHDFNNLLTGIMGYQDLSLEMVDEESPVRTYLGEARKATQRACELVEQILMFSRQTGGTDRVPVYLAPIVEEARRFLRATVPATVRIQTTVSPDCNRVLADASQINQVLINLGSNAAHAMRSNPGILGITLDSADLDATQAAAHGNLPAGRYVRLTVSDTGHGMSEDTRRRIFDPFFTTKAVGEGTGLGLAIVHGIVRGHGGAIEVESEPGQGTSFRIYLPAAVSDAGEAAATVEAPPRGQGEVICAVDDEQLVAQATRLALERHGYRCVVFNSPDACLAALRRESAGCDLLLSDQTMPGMTGMELSAEVRRFAPGLPIIIMSGYFSKVSAGALEQIGNISLMAKPFTADELARAVHRSLHPGSSGTADQAQHRA